MRPAPFLSLDRRTQSGPKITVKSDRSDRSKQALAEARGPAGSISAASILWAARPRPTSTPAARDDAARREVELRGAGRGLEPPGAGHQLGLVRALAATN